jgi:hypothetical protein
METVWLLSSLVLPEMDDPDAIADLAFSCVKILGPVIKRELWDKELQLKPGEKRDYLAWSVPRRPFETALQASAAVGIMLRFHRPDSMTFFLVGQIPRSGGYDLFDTGRKIFAFLDQQRAELFAYANSNLKAFTM